MAVSAHVYLRTFRPQCNISLLQGQFLYTAWAGGNNVPVFTVKLDYRPLWFSEFQWYVVYLVVLHTYV